MLNYSRDKNEGTYGTALEGRGDEAPLCNPGSGSEPPLGGSARATQG